MTTFETYFDGRRAVKYERMAHLFGLSVIVLGIAVLVGWANDIVVLTRVMPRLVAMQPNTALCFILAGSCLVAARWSHQQKGWRILQISFALVISLLSITTLGEHALNAHFGIDDMLMAVPIDPIRPHPSGRMAVATATGFALIGLSLFLLASERSSMFREGAALLAGIIATLSLTGYAYGVAALYGVGFYSTMAVHTAIGMLAVSLGLIIVRPQSAIVAVLVSNTLGGVLARRLLPLALIAPFVLGLLCIQGERAHLYQADFGVAMTSVTYISLFSIAIWRTAYSLQQLDSARRDAECGQQEQQAQMKGLVDSAMDGIIMINGEQKILSFNAAAEKMFGYQASEIIGCSLETLMPERFRLAHGAHVRRFDAESTYSRPMGLQGYITGIRADSAEFPVEVSISKFESSKGMRYTAIVRDVTERKNAEIALQAAARREWVRAEELSKLLNAVPAAVCFAHDPLAEELSGNELYHKWFRSPQTTPAAVHITEVAGFPPPGKPSAAIGVHADVDALLQAAQGREIRDHELSCLNADGTTRYLLGNALPLFDEHGSAIGAISAFIDVTARKHAELAMLSAMAASVAKSTFITHLTHELRTPLSTMLGHAQMLELAKIPPAKAQAKSIEQILIAGWYMRDLINDVQSIAAIETGTLSMTCERMSIDMVLSEVVSMLDPLFLKAGIRVELPLASGLEVEVNPMRIRQVLINLLSNAIKYNRPGGRIVIRCAKTGGQRVRVSVEDTGYGLAPDKLDQLFQPFNRLGQERGVEIGTGVGLVVTKKLVESMGGAIGVESEVGRGTLVWFCVPCCVESVAQEKVV